ncbi:MAG TPA: EamA family transporter, partial [Ornithinibacter sp.]|nr:EamA family transporter [Ornithinibacter sp.]
MTSAADRVPAPLLVLAGIVSVQFGGALAATLVPVIGAGGSVVMRLLFATALLLAMVRPRWRGHSRGAWRTVIAFGVSLGMM